MFVHDGRPFHTVAAARLFSTLAALGLGPITGTCQWAVERATWVHDEDGPELWERVEDCGAETIYHDEGWQCVAGHEHTTMEARERGGWDYAGDAHDAAVIMRGGREARPMGPRTVIDPHEVARAFAAIG